MFIMYLNLYLLHWCICSCAGGDLRCGAVDGQVSAPVQPVLSYVRQRAPKRHRHGSFQCKRPA